MEKTLFVPGDINHHLQCKVYNFHETNYREASEEPHGSTYSSENIGKLGSVVHCHSIKGWSVEENSDKT